MEDQEIFNKWEEFKRILKSTTREGIDNIIKWLDESDFKTAPASTQYHSSIKGGLLLHSLQVYYHMYDFNNLIQFFDIPNDTIAIVALLHDVCKVDTYSTSYRNVKNENGEWTKVPFYTVDEKIPYGHGEKSVMMITEYIKLTSEEKYAIRWHMGYTEPKELYGTIGEAYKRYPIALLMHEADLESTYFFNI